MSDEAETVTVTFEGFICSICGRCYADGDGHRCADGMLRAPVKLVAYITLASDPVLSGSMESRCLPVAWKRAVEGG